MKRRHRPPTSEGNEMNHKAGWETPDVERIGHAADARSGEEFEDVENQDSNPSGPF